MRLTVSIRTTAGPTLATASTISVLPCCRGGLGAASLMGVWVLERPGRPGSPWPHPTNSNAAGASSAARQRGERGGMEAAWARSESVSFKTAQLRSHA